MKELGYGEKYKYPHDFDNNFLIEKYFPKEMNGNNFTSRLKMDRKKS